MMRINTRGRGVLLAAAAIALALAPAAAGRGGTAARAAAHPGTTAAVKVPAGGSRAVAAPAVVLSAPGAAARDTPPPVLPALSPPSKKCTFTYDSACESLDPSVSWDVESTGETSMCTASATTNWGDGTPPTTAIFPGGPPGALLDAGDHTYDHPGNYTITSVDTVLSGNCTIDNAILQFKLDPLITNPPDNSVVAMTDGKYVDPQPAENERAWDVARSFTVSGIDNCSCAVTVNGNAATISGTTWSAKFPVTESSTGPLKVSLVTGEGEHDTATITLVDLRVASPAENAKVPLTAAPAMPDLNATPAIDGLPPGQDPGAIEFHWTLQMINRYVVPKDTWLDDMRKAATGTTTGTAAPWKIPPGTPVIGGWGKLTVTASIPGAAEPVVTSEPRWIDIPGTNPTKADIGSYIAGDADGGSHADALTHIACEESNHTFHQFNDDAQALRIRYRGKWVPEDATSDKIPDGWPNPAPLRPLFGTPSGVGVMQLDPATFPTQQWDWHANILRGIDIFVNEKLPRAAAWRGKRQDALDKVRAADLASVNAARKAKKMPPQANPPKITVAAYTAAELDADTIRGYNGYGGGHQFVWGQQYKKSDDGLQLTVTGDPKWEKNTAIPPKDNPNYVDQVLACT
jgi:hypothetical protein